MPINRENIFRMIREGRTAVLLGGDIKLYENMRINPEIIKYLAEDCNYPSGFPLSLPEVGEYFAEINGKSQLVEKVVELVDTEPGDSPFLDILARIKTISDIFTTTMDECIQTYFPQGELIAVRSDIDVSRIFSRPRHLYRLNGSINNSQQMILTRADLINLLSARSKPLLISHLIYNLTSRQFLIFGHNLREWNFSFYFELITEYLGEFREKAILFCDNPDCVLVSYWSKKNIEVLQENPLHFFLEYLDWEGRQ